MTSNPIDSDLVRLMISLYKSKYKRKLPNSYPQQLQWSFSSLLFPPSLPSHFMLTNTYCTHISIHFNMIANMIREAQGKELIYSLGQATQWVLEARHRVVSKTPIPTEKGPRNMFNWLSCILFIRHIRLIIIIIITHFSWKMTRKMNFSNVHPQAWAQKGAQLIQLPDRSRIISRVWA